MGGPGAGKPGLAGPGRRARAERKRNNDQEKWCGSEGWDGLPGVPLEGQNPFLRAVAPSEVA